MTTRAPEKSALSGGGDSAWKKQLWKAKLGFAGGYFGFSAINPYYSILYASKGFSATGVGLLSAANPVSLLVLLPPMAYLSDRHGIAVPITVVAIIISAMAVTTMTISGSMTVVAVAAVVHYLCCTPIYALFDHHTMSMLPESQKTTWGKIRVFGAYGWGVGAPFASLLIDQFGWAVLAIPYTLGTLCIAFAMISGKTLEEKQTEMKYREVWRFLFEHPRLLVFLGCVCFMGAGYVLISTFLFLFLKELGAPDILLGISITTTVIVEIPLFQFSKQLHARFTDRQIFSAAAIGWVVRVVGYSLLPDPWLVLFLEPLHGFTFGCMWLSGVHMLGSQFPKELATSSFGFLHAAAFGVGPIVGNIVGGYLYDTLGARWMFRVTAAVMAMMLCVFHIAENYFEQQEQEQGGDGVPSSMNRSTCNVAMPSAFCLVESPRNVDDLQELPVT